MKSTYRILPLFLLSMSFFTSCEKEPEVGSTLFPSEEVSFGPKAYILEKRSTNNEKQKLIEELKTGLVVEEETDSFFIRCTNPLNSDLKVTVAYDQVAAEVYGDGIPAFESDAFELLNSVVTIPAGKQESSEPVRYKITKNKALESMGEAGIGAFKITSIDGVAALSNNYNTFYVRIEKKYNYLNPDMSFEGLEPLSFDKYVVKFAGKETNKVSDGSLGSYIAVASTLEFVVELKENTKFTGFSYQAHPSYGGYSPAVAEVLFSKDGEKYVSYGTYHHPSSNPGGSLVKVGVNEYVTKFVKLRFSEPYYKVFGSRFDTPLVSELRIYANE